ncbi:MAG: substrate-binding domain-containing protein [Candidatus Bathyarchaeia archaeon]
MISLTRRTKAITILSITAALILLGAYSHATCRTEYRQRLIVSTTTSLYETGLLDALKSEFERNHPSINVSFISQGTGLALQTAMRGDADLILVHDPAREFKFLKDGYGVNRKIVAYNFYVIVGPGEDSAKVEGALSAVEAFKKIKEAGEKKTALWVSRGDDSGTHAREKDVWKDAGFNVSELRNMDWYLEAGSGMAATLKLADEKEAYTLSDLGSYLNNYVSGNIKLKALVETGKDLLNVYSVIAVNPRKSNALNLKFEASKEFIKFLVSDRAQMLIEEFGEPRLGKPLFHSYIQLMRHDDQKTMRWIQELAYFNGSECPPEYRYQAEELYQIKVFGNLRTSVLAATVYLENSCIRSLRKLKILLLDRVI